MQLAHDPHARTPTPTPTPTPTIDPVRELYVAVFLQAAHDALGGDPEAAGFIAQVDTALTDQSSSSRGTGQPRRLPRSAPR